ncbi:flippase [Enterococcus faecium]|uniref:flippase n=1 Tax=Enterococcus faecium TaxID=1352 RepID=UPI0013E914D3|nr:flippase [Enterococcus faecium]
MNRLIKNYAYNLCYQILVMILPVITTPYVSRVLKAEGVGEFNYSYAIVSVAVIIAQLGTNMYGQREIAYVQNNKIRRSEVFWSIFVIRIISSFIVFPVYILISATLHSYTVLLISMSVYLVANIFDVSWFFQGMEDFKKTAIRSMAVKLIGVVLIFLLVKNENDVVLYSVILAGTQLLGNALLCCYIPKYVRRISIHDISITPHIRPILGLFLPTAAVYIYTYVDKIILGMFSTDAQVGLYSQPEKIVKLLMTVITSLGAVMLPHIAVAVKENNINRIRKEVLNAVSFVFCIGAPMVVGAIIIAKTFIPWFLGDGYAKSIYLFQLLSPLILIIGFASVVGQAVLIPMKRQRIYTLSIMTGAVINLVVNLALIPHFEAVGAAIGTIFAELTVTAIQCYEVRNCIELKMTSIITNVKNYLIGALIMGGIGGYVSSKLPNSVISTFITVILCILLYSIILICMKDKLLMDYLKRRKNR